jgi:integrase
MLTDKAIRALKPREKPYRVADAHGLCIEVRPSGAKFWRLRYRIDGKAGMVALGEYPEIGLSDARDLAHEARKAVRTGISPTARVSRSEGKYERFSEVAQEWLEKKHRPAVTERYAAETWARIERYALPHIGHMRMRDINAGLVLDLLKRIESLDVIVTMHKVKSHLSQIFRYAIPSGRALLDPTRDLTDALRARPTGHYPTFTDVRDIARLMAAIRSYRYPVMRTALLMGAYTFVRPGELRRAEWTEFDLDIGEWRIPPEKMKARAPHIVPLARQVIGLVEGLKELTGAGKYLFPSQRTAERPMSDAAVNAALAAMGYDTGRDITAHGFRAMASTRLNEMGYNRDWIERQLAHAERDKVRGAYNYAAYLADRRRMMQEWADYLDDL